MDRSSQAQGDPPPTTMATLAAFPSFQSSSHDNPSTRVLPSIHEAIPQLLLTNPQDQRNSESKYFQPLPYRAKTSTNSPNTSTFPNSPISKRRRLSGGRSQPSLSPTLQPPQSLEASETRADPYSRHYENAARFSGYSTSPVRRDDPPMLAPLSSPATRLEVGRASASLPSLSAMAPNDAHSYAETASPDRSASFRLEPRRAASGGPTDLGAGYHQSAYDVSPHSAPGYPALPSHASSPDFRSSSAQAHPYPATYSPQRTASYAGVSGSEAGQSPISTSGGTPAMNFEMMESFQGEQHPKRRRGNLPKSVTDVLRAWFHENLDHPYPSEEEKQRLMCITGLTMSQISNWFINARRRQLPNLYRQAQAETMAQVDLERERQKKKDKGEESRSIRR